MRKLQIYLTWDAYRAGFIATAGALEKLSTQENVVIDKVFYLHNQSITSKNHDGWQAFLGKGTVAEYEKKYKEDDKVQEEIKRCWAIGKDYPKSNMKIESHRLNIKSVTDYQSIYNQIVLFLKSDIEQIETYDLHINVSPGTPQMHVVWLMLNSAGYLPPQTKLWASQVLRNKVGRSKMILSAIKFKPKTFLSEVLASSYDRTRKVVINPNDTKSTKRKEVEDSLRLYSSIPKIPILILGERGTGKSTYVETLIRDCYEGTDFPYQKVICGTLSEDLMRSELFGHVEGAFTGATGNKKGRLAKFKKEGILFLDEIHDLSKSLQRQLIEVFQTGEYYPVGSEKKEKIKISRIIVASNYPYQKLRDEILDADFFDRVARFVIEVPALRNCKEDLENYWKKTWDKLATFEAAPKLIWNKQIETYLFKAELSGNFRDLQKLVSYLMAFQLREKNIKKALKLAIEQYEKWQSKPSLLETENSYLVKGATYRTIINQFNYDLVAWAKGYYGSIEEASKVLDRSVSTLYQDVQKGRS